MDYSFQVIADMTPYITFGPMSLSRAGVQLPTKRRKHEDICSLFVRTHSSF